MLMMMMMARQDECRRPYRLIGYLCSPVEPTRRAQADQLEANLLQYIFLRHWFREMHLEIV
jgi:hypothetical protein